VDVLAAPWTGHDTLLLVWAGAAIAIIVVLIAQFKVHPFIALIIGAAFMGLASGMKSTDVVEHFTKGVGSTLGNVGLIVALGTMLGKLLADSGGADKIVSTVLGWAGDRRVPWAMALIAMIVGIPLFFEIGVVLLMPVILGMALRTGSSIIRVGIPALAGLSVLHGLVPPHPGPLIAVDALKADLGQTMFFGLIVAIPTVIIAGPIFGAFIGRHVNPQPPAALVAELTDRGAGGRRIDTADDLTGTPGSRDLGDPGSSPDGDPADRAPRPAAQTTDVAGKPSGKAPSRGEPGFGVTIATVLLPVVLMLGKTLADVTLAEGHTVRNVADLIGNPVSALLISVVVAMFTFGYLRGFSRGEVNTVLSESLAPIAGIVMIIGAGGGFKQMLIEAGIGESIGKAAENANLSLLLLGWLIAVAIRLATGSATVATITAAGIVAPLVGQFDVHPPLLALAIGAGSLFFSHVNDAGFWLVKEYFGMSIGQTIKSWSVMETIISVVALGVILLLSLFV
jgi:gluconate:H+ symporter, GntP family